MYGMNGTTGQYAGDKAHLRQSVRDVLTTPVGSRVMLRDYGIELSRLIDRPINAELELDVYAAVIAALWRWEPRLEVERVSLASAKGARLVIDVDGRRRLDGQAVKLEGIVVS